MTLPPGMAVAWGARPPGRRGPKPTFTVAQIVAVAVELGDADGYVAISLPRIAARLGVTATAVHRQVGRRDELLALLLEAGWGTPPPSVRRARGWRRGARAWTLALVTRLGEHPWLLDIPVRTAPLTPNLLAWLEAFLHVMRDSGLEPDQLLGCAVLLDGYARSTARLAGDISVSSYDPRATAEFLVPRLAGAGLPLVAELLGSGAYATSAVDREWGLTRVLDGIAELVRSTQPTEAT